ncbi:transglycosylase SLT domain-containing protein [Azonexus sp.]|uniref:lytic transglycosylase domain-containing protein n=1 Tax=Azonexus sp. TaxID=1872668 RepID=UPI0039E4443F
MKHSLARPAFSLTFSFATLRPLLAVCALGWSAQLVAQTGSDSAFTAAREAFRKGDLPRLELAIGQMGEHPLAVYAENYRLRNLLAKQDDSGIPAFLDAQAGSYVAEKLRADWLRWLVKEAQWRRAQAAAEKLLAADSELTCLAQNAALQLGDTSVLAAVEALWFEQASLPDTCQPVLDALVASGRMDVDAVWARARLQIEINRPQAARRTLDYLPQNRVSELAAFDAAHKNAMAYLVRQPAHWAATRGGRELTAIALRYVAANDPRTAAAELSKRQNALGEASAAWAWSQIALQAARKHLPESLSYYQRAGSSALSEENQQWKVRSALRQHAWSEVRQAILAMPEALAECPEWVYWLGRAEKAGGRSEEAQKLFSRIAGQANFYGNLAQEELGRSVLTPPSAAPLRLPEMQAARENPGLQRALAFFRLDLRTEAVREWNWALRGMSDRQLLAAARLAEENKLWDRAINTAERTREEHDYQLRFLAPYADQIRPAARQQALDDAWVYGLMRQESRFIGNARSSVGASGLMQLMPATAKWVAKKIGLRDYDHSRVNDTDTNVLLGTSYMRMVMDDLDQHPVLASAAYNAGPGRARRWRAEQPLEGAIYAETIPFSETRDYVKKVMSNAVYYSIYFNNRPDSLKNRLGTVAASPAGGTKNSDLP